MRTVNKPIFILRVWKYLDFHLLLFSLIRNKYKTLNNFNYYIH